jgi:hypothetical protein
MRAHFPGFIPSLLEVEFRQQKGKAPGIVAQN